MVVNYMPAELDAKQMLNGSRYILNKILFLLCPLKYLHKSNYLVSTGTYCYVLLFATHSRPERRLPSSNNSARDWPTHADFQAFFVMTHSSSAALESNQEKVESFAVAR